MPESKINDEIKVRNFCFARIELAHVNVGGDARQKGEPSRRLKATDLGEALGLKRSAWSEHTGPLTNLDFCETLWKEPRQGDRRKAHYVITDKGKEALNEWLKRQFTLPEDTYDGAEMDRARRVLEKLKAEVKTRMKEILP